MHPHGFIQKAGVGSLLLLLSITALVVMEPLGVPRQVVVRQRHDAWVLAYPLGKVETLLQVVSPIDEDTEAHYYSLIAHQGQRVHVDLHAWAEPGRPPPRLRLEMVGPGLSSQRASEPSRMEEGDMRRAGPARSSLALQVPVRGQYILVVRAEERRAGAYRIRFRGRGSWRLSALLRYPLQQIDAASLLWPERARAWTWGTAGAGSLFAGLGYLWRRRRAVVR